jgi:hypothetical protein
VDVESIKISVIYLKSLIPPIRPPKFLAEIAENMLKMKIITRISTQVPKGPVNEVKKPLPFVVSSVFLQKTHVSFSINTNKKPKKNTRQTYACPVIK